ncbi:MAG: hypothetical protein IJE43_18845 [Alphaproteobacteria bacterium]|nr:hypothetical protein [Alphaproteobacteria bacterium]
MNREYEYISALSTEEKQIFVECFCCMICSDKNVVKEEIEFLKKIGKMYDIAEKDIVLVMKSLNKEQILEKVTSLTTRSKSLHLIKELCYLANTDSGLDDSEIDFIIDVAERLNIENDKIKQINKWVLDKILLQKTGDVILEKE